MSKSITLTPDSWIVTESEVPTGDLRSLIPGFTYAAITGRGTYLNPLASQLLSYFDAAPHDERITGEVVLFSPHIDIEETLLPVVRGFTASEEELDDPKTPIMVRRRPNGHFTINVEKIEKSLAASFRRARHEGTELEKEDLLDVLTWSAVYEHYRYQTIDIIAHEVMPTLAAHGGFISSDSFMGSDLPDYISTPTCVLWRHVIDGGTPLSDGVDDLEEWMLLIDFLIYLFDDAIVDSDD